MTIGGFGGLFERSRCKYTFDHNSSGCLATQVFDRRARACATPPSQHQASSDCGVQRNDHICSVIAERDPHGIAGHLVINIII